MTVIYDIILTLNSKSKNNKWKRNKNEKISENK